MYQHVLHAFYSTPLALLPAKAEEIRSLLHARAAGERLPDRDLERMVAEREGRQAAALALPEALTATRRPDGALQVGKVGLLPVFGILAQRVGLMEAMSGGISTEKVGAALDSLVNDNGIRSIVMSFDSPGGSVFGIEELGSKIRGARMEKKIVGIADSMAASAAYWLICQCSEVNVTPGGQVGSIGVIAAHTDVSKSEELAGEKTTLITAGQYKAEGHPYGPLTDEARAELQSKVDAYYSKFVSAVARGRNTTEARVERDFGQGRMAMAKDAVSRGMADHVATLEQVLRRLGASEPQGVSPGMAAVRARAVEVEAWEVQS